MCMVSGRLTQEQIVALDQGQPVAGPHDDVALDGVAHAVVERRHAHFICRGSKLHLAIHRHPTLKPTLTPLQAGF